LDSAIEKSYQAPFCQILSAQGHTILHSTRHSPLEFGKDILTIDPDGTPCAYQLKSNPGSRLTLQQFREIQGQLVQLVTQPIELPGRKVQRHKTFLVTNGEIDEEVRVALNGLNRGFEVQQTIGRSVETISRGQLLAWVVDLGLNLWPSELEDLNTLLQLLVTDGTEIFPVNLLHKLLAPLLYLTTHIKGTPKAISLKRKITSAAILTSVALKNFELEKNYFAIISAWVTYCAYVMAACDRFSYSYNNNGKKAVEIAYRLIFKNLSDLCDELRERKHFVEGNAFVDTFTYKGRFTLLVALTSLYWFWCENEGWPHDTQRNFLQTFIPSDFSGLYLWGEGAVPQLLIHLWYLRAKDATVKPDHLLAQLLGNIVALNTNKQGIGLPSPYYNFEEIVRHTLRDLLGLREDPFRGDSFKNDSFFALGLLHLLVRTNLKQACKYIWPDFSKLGQKYFSPPQPWRYCLHKSDDGEEITNLPPLTKQWEELVEESRDISCPEVPYTLKANKFLLLLFIIIFPYRAIPSVIRFLGKEFNDCWFIPPPKT